MPKYNLYPNTPEVCFIIDNTKQLFGSVDSINNCVARNFHAGHMHVNNRSVLYQ